MNGLVDPDSIAPHLKFNFVDAEVADSYNVILQMPNRFADVDRERCATEVVLNRIQSPQPAADFWSQPHTGFRTPPANPNQQSNSLTTLQNTGQWANFGGGTAFNTGDERPMRQDT